MSRYKDAYLIVHTVTKEGMEMIRYGKCFIVFMLFVFLYGCSNAPEEVVQAVSSHETSLSPNKETQDFRVIESKRLELNPAHKANGIVAAWCVSYSYSRRLRQPYSSTGWSDWTNDSYLTFVTKDKNGKIERVYSKPDFMLERCKHKKKLGAFD